MNYSEFLERKSHLSGLYGIEPLIIPNTLFDFQKYVSEYNCTGIDTITATQLDIFNQNDEKETINEQY
jgi:hypothetical protein